MPSSPDDEVPQLGRALNTMLDALAAALERERDFVRDASHELRKPLILLTARVQSALRNQRTVAQHETILREVQTDLDRLNRLAERLLRAKAPDSARNGSYAGSPRRRGQVEVSLGEVELAQVVGNLLDDALLHGQAPVKVRVNRAGLIGRTGRGVARLEVEDSGPGTDPQLLATATRRFTRAAESRSRPGFSLGLVPGACPVGLLSWSG